MRQQYLLLCLIVAFSCLCYVYSYRMLCDKRTSSLFGLPRAKLLPHDRFSTLRVAVLDEVDMADARNYQPNALKRLLSQITKPITSPVRNSLTWLDKELPMLRYLWPKDNLKLRCFLILSLAFMFAGKWVNVQVPFIMQKVLDTAHKLEIVRVGATAGKAASAAASTTKTFGSLPLFLVPLAKTLSMMMNATPVTSAAIILLLFYGGAKALSVMCAEIKTSFFAHVSQNVLRKYANSIFSHLHSLDSEFFTATPSGVISVAYARAVRGFQTMIFQIVFTIFPVVVELAMVCQALYRRCGMVFSGITFATFSVYLAFTLWITQWRVRVREELVSVDNARNGFFIDSILNQETVKLYTQEKKEGKKFDSFLSDLQRLQIESTYAIAALNFGQALIFSSGLTISLLIALQRVSSGMMSVGDLIAVNASLLQLSIPFNFIGYTYQELRQSFVDMSFMNSVLTSARSSVNDVNKHVDMNMLRPKLEKTGKWQPGKLDFKNVSFKYSSKEIKVKEGYKAMANEKTKEIRSPGEAGALSTPAEPAAGASLKFNFRGTNPQGNQKSKVSVSSPSLESDQSSDDENEEKESQNSHASNEATITASASSSSSSAQPSQSSASTRDKLLNNVSFSVLPGENVAIVGPSGSGKSTVLKLMTRMIDPTDGGVYIDNINARDVSLRSLRERIAVVPQDTSLFDETIEYNILYGNTQATDLLEKVISDTNLHSVINKFENGIQTRVGERGNRLSGGERQRISIARALLKDPSIILCDEVTSAVDAFTEKEITDVLRFATNQRSTVTVAHRLSSICHCDKIIVLEKGQIVQQGNHMELLRDVTGVYARMWEAQQGPSNCIIDPDNGDSTTVKCATHGEVLE